MLVAPEIIQVQIPLPFALKIVNCYLLRGPAGWALLDTGINWPPAIAAWEAALATYGLQPRDVGEIYVTHYHPDHIGLAGWWQERSGAPVFMTPVEHDAVLAVWGGSEPAGQGILTIFRQHGMPEDLLAALAANVAETRRRVQPLPEITPLLDLSGPLSIVGRPFQPLVLAGHADAQLALHELASGTLLIADHVLEKISPNISYGPRPTHNPLGRYLDSFALLEGLAVERVLPGHGPLFADLRRRLDQLRAHHEERLAAMEALLGEESTAYEVSRQVFPMEQLSAHQHQFAIGETLAHLDYLVLRGRAVRVDDAPIRYRRVEVIKED